MVDEKQNLSERPGSLPIPSYEEAISSRPSSSQFLFGATENSHDLHQHSLPNQQRLQSNYEARSIESARSSLSLLPSPGQNTPSSSSERLQREMVQMEIADPESGGRPRRLGRIRFSKHINRLVQRFSSINLPFRQWLPSSDYIRAQAPSFPYKLRPNWIIVGRIFALLLVLSLAYMFLLSDLFTRGRRSSASQSYDLEALRSFSQGYIDETYIRESARRITSFDHVAGTEGSLYLAKWVEGLFNAARFEYVGLERFDVYLNFPKQEGRRVAIVEPPELVWEATIEEKSAHKNPNREQTLVFHGHSKSGNVTGPLIYANYGHREDFKKLKDQGVDLTGTIVLVRYHDTQEDGASKVRAAELVGAIGCIIYSDFAETSHQTDRIYPAGRSMPSDGAHRDSVSLMSWVVGDVLSGGFASHPGESRRDSKKSNPGINNIPSIPLAWKDASRLLQALKGHGKMLSGSWKGFAENIEWWSGNQSSPIVHLMNDQDEVDRRPIYNVIGKITGLEQPEKFVIVGNHRDAWCFGATDPGSGTAVLLEVVRIFGKLRELGWRPLRSIVFASWDGGKYNLIGSTEHVEARMDELRKNGIAYLNVDVAVGGTEFNTAANPLFESVLLRILDRITDPITNKSLSSMWNIRNSPLQGSGAASDCVAFQDMAGTSSIDIGFGGSPYPYHSCYDSFDWMEKYGDPSFQYHKTLAQIWTLLILEMADSRLLPFDFNAYSRAISGYVADLERYAKNQGALRSGLNLQSLHRAADEFVKDSRAFHEFDRNWVRTVAEHGGFENNVMAIKRMSHNTRMANFETNLLDVDGGLSGRKQFKHILFAPQKWSSSDVAYFPSVRDAIDDGDWELAQKEIEKVARILLHASRKLLH